MARILAALYGALLLIGAAASSGAQAQGAADARALGANEAHAGARAGELVLVDIRTPQEWRETGVPASAHAITMNQDPATFLRLIEAAAGGSRQKPVALICAVGSRSSYMRGRLQQAGFATVVDVAEGVVGGRRGTGWIKSGLPVRRWAPGLDKPETNRAGSGAGSIQAPR